MSFLTLNSIGFMQGRLSPIIDNKIQAFPIEYWEKEFLIAMSIGLKKIEWTLDYHNLWSNPLMSRSGREQIKEKSEESNMKIIALTADFFMQKPFFKSSNRSEKEKLKNDFHSVCIALSKLQISQIIVPLVDNSSILSDKEESDVINFFLSDLKFYLDLKLKVVFESDYYPKKLRSFIDKLPKSIFGINYDTGNSAALGFKPFDEWRYLGNRITHVHIKDRMLGGDTVRLGSGSADFKECFDQMKKYEYHGDLVLQTARSATDEHTEEIERNISFLKSFLNEL